MKKVNKKSKVGKVRVKPKPVYWHSSRIA